jgi:hypothetical protein
VLVRDNAPELRLVHDWLDSWSGIGLIIAGMTHQGWDVQLTAYAARDWRAIGLGADAVARGPAGGQLAMRLPTTSDRAGGARLDGKRRLTSVTIAPARGSTP